MRTVFGNVVGVVLMATAAVAADPPPIPAHLLPPVVTPLVPNLPPSPRVPLAPPGSPLTREALDRLPISGPSYFDLLRSISSPTIAATSTTPVAAPQTKSIRSGRASRRLAPVSLAYSEPPIQVSSDALVDVEPSTTALNVGGVPYSATTWIKYESVLGETAKLARLQYASTSDFANFTRGELPMTSGAGDPPLSSTYSRSNDPIMSGNPYSGGIASKRMYTVGVLNNGSPNLYSAIGVWRSDDGGNTWSSPREVEVRGGGNCFLDRPSINVSWHSGSLGYVYVAYVSIDYGANANALVVERSTDGGLSFGSPFVIAWGLVTSPQVVVNSNTGAVSVLWTDFTTRDIRMSTSTDFGLSFGPHEIIMGGAQTASLNGEVRAYSYPVARFHWPTGRIIVAAHLRSGNGDTDVYYGYKPCSSDCNYYGWKNPVRINDDAGANDQFMPGIDFNVSGNVVIAFYDRRDDPGNNLYHEYYAFINADGAALQANQRISAFASDPSLHVVEDGPDQHFIGDYQDCWDWMYASGDRAVPAFIGIPGKGETYLSRISY